MKRLYSESFELSRPTSPMSISSKSSKSGKRSSGYSLLDSARTVKKVTALQNLIYKLCPDYDHVTESGYTGTQADYSQLIKYASKVYKQTTFTTNDAVVTHADQEVPWLALLRERISKVLSE